MRYVVDFEVWTAPSAAGLAEDRFDYRSQRDVDTHAIQADQLDDPDTRRAVANQVSEQIVLYPGQYVFVTSIAKGPS